MIGRRASVSAGMDVADSFSQRVVLCYSFGEWSEHLRRTPAV